MACLQFRQAQTIHKWSGIGDGHISKNVLLQKIMTDGDMQKTKSSVQEADVLFIDEVGMMSSQLLGNVEYICRNVRQTQRVFGGLQVVASGCFRQLPPVPSSSDPGEYCFMNPLFNSIFPHQINLTDIKRQTDTEFIRSIHAMSLGCPSQETKDFIKSLKRPLPRNLNPTYIFGTNFDCDFFNEYKLDKLRERARIYRAIDDGQYTYFKGITAPRNLSLKINCKVIITRNLFNGLVNGLEAKIIAMEEDKIKIRVNSDEHLQHHMQGKEFELHRYAFIQRNDQNEVKAVRTQFPVKLGYGITVDKSQGRTLSSVVVDCYNFWRPGQLAVAMSRATSKNFLQIMNFNNYACDLKHPECVDEYYNTLGSEMQEDLSCCQMDVVHRQYDLNYVQMTIPSLHECLNEETHSMMTENVTIKPFPWNREQFLCGLCENNVTDTQKMKKKIIQSIKSNKEIEWFLGKHYSFIDMLLKEYSAGSKGTKCNLCFLSAHLHRYLTSTIYLECCKKAFRTNKLLPLENNICTDICLQILSRLANERAIESQEEIVKEVMNQQSEEAIEIDSDLRATIRYISGAAIHNVCKHLRSSHDRQIHFNIKKKITYLSYKIMNRLRIPEEILKKETLDPHSVAAICARQLPKRGLVHVSDQVLEFFEMLYLNIARVQSLQMIHICHQSLLKMTKAMLYKDTECISTWFKLFEGCEELASCHYFMDNSFDMDDASEDSYDMGKSEVDMDLLDSIVLHLYNKVVSYFCKVHFSELLKTLKEKSGKKKSQPIRTQLSAMEISGQQVVEKKLKYPCAVCNQECKSYFTTYEDSSIQCSMCNILFHFPCAEIKGNEHFVKKGSSDDWYCKKCKDEHNIIDYEPGARRGRAKSRQSKTSGIQVSRGRGRGRYSASIHGPDTINESIYVMGEDNIENNRGRGRGKGRGRGRGGGRGRGRGRGKGMDKAVVIANDNCFQPTQNASQSSDSEQTNNSEMVLSINTASTKESTSLLSNVSVSRSGRKRKLKQFFDDSC